jgi:hypothetical protein
LPQISPSVTKITILEIKFTESVRSRGIPGVCCDLIIHDCSVPIGSDTDTAMKAARVIESAFRMALISGKLEIMSGAVEIAGDKAALLEGKTDGVLGGGIAGIGEIEWRAGRHGMAGDVSACKALKCEKACQCSEGRGERGACKGGYDGTG